MITHPDESYYRNGRTTETERLRPRIVFGKPQPWPTEPTAPLATNTTPAYLPQDMRPLIGLALIVIGLVAFGLVVRSIVAAAIFSAGYAAGHAVGVLQPWIDARGWVALVVFSIAGTSFLIYRHNRIVETCTPPKGY